MFESCVQSTISYEVEVWEICECKHARDFSLVSSMQIGKLHPYAAVVGDMGLIPMRIASKSVRTSYRQREILFYT